MSEEIVVIVGKSYTQGMAWLKMNAKKYNLDPQKCRVTSQESTFLGMKNLKVFWLRGWSAGANANAIRNAAQVARSKGWITSEEAP